MPFFSATKGGTITKDDLDFLAVEANRALTPFDVDRTKDLRRDGDPTYSPGTMTGAFSFSPVAGAPRWAWLDEINRIWRCLWNIFPGYPGLVTGNDDWDVAGVATTRVNHYWTVTSDTGHAGQKIVASPGPHCLQATNNPTNPIIFYKYVRALFSREQPAFDIYSGLITVEISLPGDGDPHVGYGGGFNSKFDYAGLVGASLWGYFEVEYTRTSGVANPVSSDYGMEFFSTSGGYGPGGTPSGFVQEGQNFYMWMGGATRNEMGFISGPYDPGSGTGTGNQSFIHWLSTAGWVFTRQIFRGGFVGGAVNSSTGIVAGDKVIHPRNESIRAELHVNYPTHLSDPDDILDFGTTGLNGIDSLLSDPGVAPFPSGQRSVDLFVRNMLLPTTRQALDDYPLTEPDPSIARAAMVQDMNDYLIDYPGTIWSASIWAGVTLRPATQWFIDLDPDDPIMRQRMNRLLLEDAYPPAAIGELKRTPDNKEAKFEVRELTLTDAVGTASFQVANNLSLGHLCSVPTAKIIYLADALPQWGYLNYLEQDLPAEGDNQDNQRGLALWGNGGVFNGNLALGDLQTSFNRAQAAAPSNWPVIHEKYFGRFTGSSSKIPDKRTNTFAPFWGSDTLHQWETASLTYPATGWKQDSVFMSSTMSVWKVAYNAGSRHVSVYVTKGTTIDPTNPATYELVADNGHFVFPDDFTAIGLVADDYLSGMLVAVKNNTGVPITKTRFISRFAPAAGEYPPIPDPNFFPAFEYNSGESDVSSYRFGSEGTTGMVLPVPQRGYMVRDVLIQRMPVVNAAGIATQPTAAVSNTVHLGIMAGAGVIAGAIEGSYPGDFIEFDTITLGDGVNEVRTATMYPVLEGCPLAYFVTGTDSTEEFNIFASVEFQPAINNTLVNSSTFNGAPFLSNTWGWHTNQNQPYAPYTRLDNWRLSTMHYDSNDIIPPASARAITELYSFLVALP